MKNREIKFRTWQEKLGMNYSPILITHNSGEFWSASVIGDGEYEIDYSVTAMQYTGLKDKNGKEIYEAIMASFPKTSKKYAKEVALNDGIKFNFKYS